MGRPKGQGGGKGSGRGGGHSLEQSITIFWSKVRKTSPNGCWYWLGARHSSGYGQCHALRKGWNAHRFAWFITFGQIPKGRWVLHHCDNPICVNPKHLFLGDAQANYDDMVEKRRQRHCLGRGKIGEEVVRFIRSIWVPYKMSVQKISDKYGWPYKSVECAVNPNKWKWVQ